MPSIGFNLYSKHVTFDCLDLNGHYFLQKCHFGIAMQDSPFKFQAYNCDGTDYDLNNFIEKIKEPFGNQYHEERKVILLRAGMDPEYEEAKDLQICSKHRSILGRDFLKAINTPYCYHLKHVGPFFNKGARMINYDEAVSFLKPVTFPGAENPVQLKLPFGLPMCNVCYSNVMQALDTEVMETEPSKESEKNEPSKESEKNESSSSESSHKQTWFCFHNLCVQCSDDITIA